MTKMTHKYPKKQRVGGPPHAAERGNIRYRLATRNVISRRYFTLLMALALILGLTACGAATSVTPLPTQTSTETSPSDESAASDAAAEDTTATRPFTDAAGRAVEIPVSPQRIVTLTEMDLDSALALGVSPVGSVNGRGQETLPSYLLERAAAVESVGSLAEPNLEAILVLNPDLILVASPIPPIEALLPELEQIAPVVVTAAAGSSWQDTLNGVAAALGRTTEAEAFLSAYAERVAALTANLPADVQEASIIRWNPDGPVVMLPNAFSSLVLADVGIGRPAAHAEMAGSHPVHSGVISMETIEVIDADIIFAGGLNPEGTTALQQTLADPLVQALTAMQAGRLVLVDGLVWGSVGGPLAAMQVLDDLERGLGLDLSSGAADAFPITLEHKFGSVTIEAAPQRVVAIGYNDQDPLLALGVTPVAVRYWFGDPANAIFPWAQEALAGENPVVMNMPFGELNYEQILALAPDLIVAVYSGITAEEYALLAQIAPTLAQTAAYADFGMPWQEATRLIGAAVGKTAAAEALVADVEATFAQTRAAHPEFAGKSIVVAAGRADSGSYAFFSAQDARTRYFTDLGFVFPPELDELTGDSFYAELSQERVDRLERDLIVFTQASYLENGADSILNDPLLGQLNAMQEGRYVILSEELDAAFSFSSVLSLSYVTQALAPQLAAALGDSSDNAAVDDAFPVTIQHKFGSTTIEAAPQRVVTIGFSEQDPVLALGVVPVGVRDWFGEQPYGVWPWAQDELGDATPELLQMPYGELNYELIASLEPDLLIATHSGITEEEYALLSQIAPTLAQPGAYPDFGVPWQVQTQLISRALGKEALANELIAAVEGQIEAANEAYNGFGSATIAWVSPAAEAGQFWVVGENTPPLRFLTELGFTY